jgi:hypothetical protein
MDSLSSPLCFHFFEFLNPTGRSRDIAIATTRVEVGLIPGVFRV